LSPTFTSARRRLFRAGGVAVPRGATASDLNRLSNLVRRTRAQRLVVLGDFLHAAGGGVPALDAAFLAFRGAHPELEILLVRGKSGRGTRSCAPSDG